MSAVEVLVALVLFALVVHGAWGVFAAQRDAASDLGRRTEILDAMRTARVVLGAEIRAGVPQRDWEVVSPGIVALRAFRGWAAVCPETGQTTEIVVAYRGLRAPDPSKDSVLVLGRMSTWAPVALLARTTGVDRCPTAPGADPPAGAMLERWRLDRPVEGAAFVRVFERGSYHLTDGTLRYARGAGGRQPLTASVLDPSESGLGSLHGGTAVGLTIRGREGVGEARSQTLLGNGRRVP